MIFSVLTFCIAINIWSHYDSSRKTPKDDKTLSYLLCSSYDCRHSPGEGERGGEKYVGGVKFVSSS